MLSAEQELMHVGETRGCANHDRDMVHDLSRRLDALWRYDQYIANADWRDKPRQFWEDMKQQEQENIRRLKELLAEEIRNDCF